MYIHAINPDLITLGPFVIRFYGIVYALGFIFISWILSKQKFLTRDQAYDVVTWGLIGGLIGARLHHVVVDFHLYANNLFGLFMIWKGGLAFQGGIVGGLLGGYWYCKKHAVDFFKVTDVVAVYMPLVLVFGRIANFINAEHVGFPTQVPWCVVFTTVDEVCRHPAQLYQALSQLILFGIMYAITKLQWSKPKKRKTWLFFIGYGVVRFITDYARSDLFHVIGLTVNQWIALLMIIGGGVLLWKTK